MTVSTELSHEEYTGNGVTTDFDFRFRIFEAKHLVVSVATPDGTERILTNGTDYTLRGVGSYRGGKVILKMPLATGWKIGIARDLPVVQETDLRNQGKFFAEVHEDAFDYLTMLIQKSLGYLSLCLRKPSFISNHYDAKGNKISNLGKPVKDGDAVDLGTMKEHISAKDKRSLRVADKDIPALPGTSVRRNKQLGFDNNGMPLLLDPVETGALGYVLVDSFEKGAVITSRYQALHWLHNGEYYRWDGDLPKYVPAGATPESAGGVGIGAWVGVGDASLRSELGVIIKRYPSYHSMISDSSLKIGDTVSSGSGRWEVLNSPVSGVSDLRMISPPSLYDFGAIGGDAEKDTEAFKFALSLDVPIVIPNTTLSKAFIIKGIIDLPKVSVMMGDCDSVQKLTEGTAFLDREQPYITFHDENSRFAGGRGSEDRVFVQWSNLLFISSSGPHPDEINTRGMAIGAINDASESAIGGRINNVVFQGFRRAFQNDWSYFFNINNVDILNCYDGLIFNDFNASNISNVYATSTANVIDTGFDSAQSTISNVGVNIGGWTEVAVRLNAGVTLEGYNYFESFGSKFKPNSTCIAYQSTYWSNRPMHISNVLFDAECEYHLTIDSATKPTGTIPAVWQLNGKISNCHFARGPSVSKVGFGINKSFNGSPTYPSLSISNFDISTCTGISSKDLRAQTDSPYNIIACKPYIHVSNYEAQSINGQTFTRLRLGKLTESNTNVVNSTVMEGGARWKIPATGLYHFSATFNLRNKTGETLRTPELQVMLNSTILARAYTTVQKNETYDATYGTVTLSGFFYASANMELYSHGRNGDDIIAYTMSVSKISNGE